MVHARPTATLSPSDPAAPGTVQDKTSIPTATGRGPNGDARLDALEKTLQDAIALFHAKIPNPRTAADPSVKAVGDALGTPIPLCGGYCCCKEDAVFPSFVGLLCRVRDSWPRRIA